VASRARAFISDIRLNPSHIIRRHTKNVPDAVNPEVCNETGLLDQLCLRRRTTVLFEKRWTREDRGYVIEWCKMNFVTTPVGTTFISENDAGVPTVIMWN